MLNKIEIYKHVEQNRNIQTINKMKYTNNNKIEIDKHY